VSGSSEHSPPLRLVVGGRSVVDSELARTDRLASLLARGASASGHGEGFAEELAQAYLDSASRPPLARPNDADPLSRHTLPPDRVGRERGGPLTVAAPVLEGVLDAVPASATVSMAPGGASAPGRSLAEADRSPQTHYRPRGGNSREKRDRRRKRERAHNAKRMPELGDSFFAKFGQMRDVPDPPPLLAAVRGMNLRMMQDYTGRRARELLAKLPYTQALAAQGVPVVFGNYMRNFADPARQLLEAQAALQSNPQRLAADLAELLKDPETAQKMGAAGAQVVNENRGAVERHMDFIKNFVK